MENTKGTKRWFWISLIFAWLSFPIYYSMLFGLAIWAIAMIILVIRKSNLKWGLLGFAPWIMVPVLSFLTGSADYFSGKAVFKHTGMPGIEFYNLDPEYRVSHSSSGCVVMGFEAFSQYPNNYAVKLWTHSLGIQPKVYTGIYPTKQETKDLLLSRKTPIEYAIKEGNFLFQFEDQSYEIHDPLSHWKRKDLEIGKAEVLIVEKELLIFKALPEETIPLYLQREITYLVDLATENVFAKYAEYVPDEKQAIAEDVEEDIK